MSYRARQQRAQAPTYFFAPPEMVVGDSITLPPDEAKHALTVCRLKRGERLSIGDGTGNVYDCEVANVGRGKLTASIVKAHRRQGEPLVSVTLAAGVGKPATFDWIVEKSVELGVARVVPVRCSHSVAGLDDPASAKRKVSRWRRLGLSAMKQSMRSVWPPVSDVITVEAACGLIEDHQMAFIADPEGERLVFATQTNRQITNALLFVGPEAGFTDEERHMFINAGAVPFTLGDRRLRAETAAIVSLTLLMRELGEV